MPLQKMNEDIEIPTFERNHSMKISFKSCNTILWIHIITSREENSYFLKNEIGLCLVPVPTPPPCTIPLGIVLQDLGRIGVEWTGSKGLEEMQLWLF